MIQRCIFVWHFLDVHCDRRRVKFIYSEKAKIFLEISSVDLSYVVTVKYTVDISQNFVAFSEYMKFMKTIKVWMSKEVIY